MEPNQNKDKTKRIQRSLNKPVFFIFPTLIGALIVFAVVMAYQSKYDFFHYHEKLAFFQVFCDAFFVSGVLVCGIGCLVLISGEGFFDMIAYGVSNAFRYLFIPKERKQHEAYIDYKLRKEAERAGGRIWFI